MANTPGWYPDPYGRFQQRYHDGTTWTEHVATGGQQQVDPMGASPVIPFAIPASALPGGHASQSQQSQQSQQTQQFAAPTGTAASSTTTATGGAAAGSPIWRFLDGLGPDARERAAPDLTIALAGIGGAVFGVGVITAIVGDESSTGTTVLAALIVLAAALAIRLFVSAYDVPMSAAVGAGAVGIFFLGAASEIEDGDGTNGWMWLLIGVLYLAAWLLPGFRGRPLMLGLGLLSLVVALAAATADDSDGGGFGDTQELARDQGVIFLIAAAVLLAIVWLLDSKGYRGVATSVVVTALVCSLIGLGGVLADVGGAEGKAILVFAVGLVLCFVGTHGQRRATTWYGAALSAAGVVTFVLATTEPSSVGDTATALIMSGLALIVVPLIIRQVRLAQHANAQTT